MKKNRELKSDLLNFKKFQIAKIKNSHKVFGGNMGLNPTTGIGDDDSNSNTQEVGGSH
ncbi:hypothetical protein [Tenacibaculum sp. M341]|uniref:hypothetical protein n=1 Tax=Tenacibaculum sp. M341 TaxID=2530339 RepID=UPI0014044B64|nr:hypothetical protein [Tenacibaculum sp. M341]